MKLRELVTFYDVTNEVEIVICHVSVFSELIYGWESYHKNKIR